MVRRPKMLGACRRVAALTAHARLALTLAQLNVVRGAVVLEQRPNGDRGIRFPVIRLRRGRRSVQSGGATNRSVVLAPSPSTA